MYADKFRAMTDPLASSELSKPFSTAVQRATKKARGKKAATKV
jgi:hypothetical protein